MQVSKNDLIYKITEVTALMWDNFLERNYYNSNLVFDRLSGGTLDLCTMLRMWVFGLVYTVFMLAIIGYGIYALCIAPFQGIAVAPGLLTIGSFVAGVLAVIGLTAIVGVVIYFGVRYLKNKRPVKHYTDEIAATNKVRRENNKLLQMIILTYRTIHEKTCFLIKIKD